jgi:feruloyl esterase
MHFRRKWTGLAALVACMGFAIPFFATAGSAKGVPRTTVGTRVGPATPGTQALPCNPSSIQPHLDANIQFNNSGVNTLGVITLNTAQMLATAAPASAPYCRVDGTIHTAEANVNDVHFQVSLPVPTFNGRFLQAGLGGASGFVQPPRDDMLNEGFVSASTDRGEPPASGLNFSQSFSSGLCQDCGFHIAAVAGERLTKAFYSQQRLVRYAAGCSAGGSDTRGNVVSYGTQDFDGVVTGDNPPSATVVLEEARIAKYLNDNPQGWISPTQLAQVQAAIVAKYDGADGTVDGIIQDDRNFTLDDQVLQNAGLTDAQIETVHFVSDPFQVHLAGLNVGGMYVGFPINSLSQWALLFGSVPPPWTSITEPGASLAFVIAESMFQGTFGPSFDLNAHTFNQLEQLFPQTAAGAPGGDGLLPKQTDYNAFKDHGGKLISYQGVGDGFVSYFDVPLTFSILNAQKGHPDLDDWARFFLIPGMDHCAGGAGPSNNIGVGGQDTELTLVNSLVKWVENGVAPNSVVATRVASASLPARTFLLCPEPQTARHNQQGDVNSAANWRCVNDPQFEQCDGVRPISAIQLPLLNPDCPARLNLGTRPAES